MGIKIIFFHTLNDHSGSPKVLSILIKGLVERGYRAELYTSFRKDGFLTGISGVKYHYIFYRFYNSKLLTLILFGIAQLRYFLAALKYWKDKDTIFYINTIMPFGAAIGASLVKKRIIYHIHEFPVKQHIIHKAAIKVFLKHAYRAIFVSDYLFNCYPLDKFRKATAYNGLSPEFTGKASKHKVKLNQQPEILMISSLKIYKGVMVYLELSRLNPQYNFTLVCNATLKDIRRFFKHSLIPDNLKIYEATNDLHSFFSRSHLVVNLSLPGLCIESFGLTILEAMSYGIPVIVPPVGGVAELVEDGVNGYKIDPVDVESITIKMGFILGNTEQYLFMSENARRISKRYSFQKMVDSVENIIVSSAQN